MVNSGLDRLVQSQFKELHGRNVAIVCNQATIDSNYDHIINLMVIASAGKFNITRVFGPQHGVWGHTQDNMIEWEDYVDPDTGLIFNSLYGAHRKPAQSLLEGTDLILFDVQDVGARYYTFMWTLMYCMEAAEEAGIEIMVLDRPNPVNCVDVEGTVLEEGWESFVGLRPMPLRHGLTIGEIGNYLKNKFYPDCKLTIHQMVNYNPSEFWGGTGLPWVMPSPNMPTPQTAIVYPGMCLLEGTKMSEGRGTTRPFEIVGAPYIDGEFLARELNSFGLPGVKFRRVSFQPTFQKYAGIPCNGVQVHVIDPKSYLPVLTTLALLRLVLENWRDQFQWQVPPYEYEYVKLPFDILAGCEWLRADLESGASLERIQERMKAQCSVFEPTRRAAMIYSR